MPNPACEPSRVADGQFSRLPIQQEPQPLQACDFSCNLMQSFLRDGVSGGDHEKFDEFQRWAAQLVQQPKRKSQTAVVLRGTRGTGKSLVASWCGEMIGSDHARTIRSGNQLTGYLNGYLRHCQLLIVEDGVLPGNGAAERVLNELITASTLVIETARSEPLERPNFLRVMILADDTWTIPATADEDRFLVLDLVQLFEGEVDAAAKRAAYFKALCNEASSGGLEAMWADLLKLDLGQSISAIRR
jgi:hypothetical protein